MSGTKQRYMTDEMLIRIKKRRKASGITGPEMAHKLGLSPTSYYDRENGKVLFDINEMLCMCSILNTTLDELLGITKAEDDVPIIEDTHSGSYIDTIFKNGIWKKKGLYYLFSIPDFRVPFDQSIQNDVQAQYKLIDTLIAVWGLDFDYYKRSEDLSCIERGIIYLEQLRNEIMNLDR